ncbi:MAG TPA: hypothetical protein DSN98_04675 [Thermoplasmata archaeon]|jgi:hypothetical protein|nr:MAG TPA: hypothetical protein DSN98_04675 [Thermoplasmata archaeon]
MRRNHLSKKGLAVFSIILFLGVAVGPCIQNNIAMASSDNNVVEVTMQACGMKGSGPHTVSLTKRQYQNLEQYLVEFSARLNKTATREETVVLFKEAVVELYKYRLLPRGISAEQAQRLVIGNYQNPKMLSHIESDIYSKWTTRHRQKFNPNLKNAFCLLYAAATKIPEYSPSPSIIPLGVLLVLGLIPAFLVSLIGAQEVANTLADVGLLIWTLNPFRAFNFVLFTGYEVELRSIGLKGLINENFNNGGIFMGYSGLMLSLVGDKTFFLGFALGVYGLS